MSPASVGRDDHALRHFGLCAAVGILLALGALTLSWSHEDLRTLGAIVRAAGIASAHALLPGIVVLKRRGARPVLAWTLVVAAVAASAFTWRARGLFQMRWAAIGSGILAT